MRVGGSSVSNAPGTPPGCAAPAPARRAAFASRRTSGIDEEAVAIDEPDALAAGPRHKGKDMKATFIDCPPFLHELYRGDLAEIVPDLSINRTR